MSIEAVTPAIWGSFVYEGCYRPRGALTFAERSAWGLCSSENRPVASGRRAPMPKFRTPARCSAPVTSTQHKPHVSAHHAGATAKRLRRRPRFRLGCLSPAVLCYHKRFGGLHTLAKPKRLTGWYRLSVKLGGGSATCLLARGRSFVTGDIRSKVD